MPVSTSDIDHLQSANAGSSGGAITGSSITSGVANNVWPDITDAERIAGVIKYRKTFYKNNHGTDAMVNPVVYFPDGPEEAAYVVGFGVNSADDADSAQGNMTAFGGSSLVALISDGADTRTATIYGISGGIPTTENVVLTGAVEVLSANSYTAVWGVYLSAISATRTVLVKQGSGGTTRGTIGINKKICWLWVNASSKGAGITLPDLPSGQNYGVWRRLTVSAGANAVRPNSLTMRIEESL